MLTCNRCRRHGSPTLKVEPAVAIIAESQFQIDANYGVRTVWTGHLCADCETAAREAIARICDGRDPTWIVEIPPPEPKRTYTLWPRFETVVDALLMLAVILMFGIVILSTVAAIVTKH